MELKETIDEMIKIIDEIILLIEKHTKKSNSFDDFIKARNILINKHYNHFYKIKSHLYSGFRMLYEVGINTNEFNSKSDLLSEYFNKIMQIIEGRK